MAQRFSAAITASFGITASAAEVKINNRSFLMLLSNEDSKTGIIAKLPSDSAIASISKNQKVETSDHPKDQKMEAGKQPTITKTGNSRVIAGYRCDEYKITEPDVDGYSDVWITKDLNIKADKQYWNKAGMPGYYGYPEFEGGVMLAMDSFDKKNNLKVKMETKEINEKVNNSISTKGYTLMQMNFGQSGKK